MHLSFTLKNTLAFLALLFVCHELHELIHTVVAYGQCGCWGERDFNAWKICAACSPAVNTLWATFAGPFLTFCLLWVGFLLMDSQRSSWQQALGWVLVFANKPFARIFTVLLRGGDEGVLTRGITGNTSLTGLSWAIEITVVLLLILPALVRAWSLLQPRKRLLVFTSFLVGPMLVEFALMHKLGNHLLASGFLAQPGLLGSPVLVNVWNAFWLLVLVLTFRQLPTLLTPSEKKQ